MMESWMAATINPPPLSGSSLTPLVSPTQAGTEPSMGSKGDSYDNALTETINGLYKAELIHCHAALEDA
jgi:transposase InsO family protein